MTIRDLLQTITTMLKEDTITPDTHIYITTPVEDSELSIITVENGSFVLIGE